MAELKTKATAAPATDFLNAIPDAQVREDCKIIAGIMQEAAKAEAKMWGPSIVGFGDYHYIYASGRENDWMLTGFSPRKQNIAIYGMSIDRHAELMAKLGKHSRGKGCLYIKRLSDIDVPTFKKLVRAAVAEKIKNKGKVMEAE